MEPPLDNHFPVRQFFGMEVSCFWQGTEGKDTKNLLVNSVIMYGSGLLVYVSGCPEQSPQRSNYLSS